jgi:uncharacterized protein (DUF2267 family)
MKWLNDVMRELAIENGKVAYAVLRGTLHVLRDRLPMEEAVHLGAQLPMLVRGFTMKDGVQCRTLLKCIEKSSFCALKNN